MYIFLIEFFGAMILMLARLTIGNYITMGILLSILIYLGVYLSNGVLHPMYNPAIAIALIINGDLALTDGLSDIFFQIIGCITAVYILKFFKLMPFIKSMKLIK